MAFQLCMLTLGTFNSRANLDASLKRNNSFGPHEPTKNVISLAINMISRPFGYSGVDKTIRHAIIPHCEYLKPI